MYSDQLKDIWLEGISYSEHANHRPPDNFFAKNWSWHPVTARPPHRHCFTVHIRFNLGTSTNFCTFKEPGSCACWLFGLCQTCTVIILQYYNKTHNTIPKKCIFKDSRGKRIVQGCFWKALGCFWIILLNSNVFQIGVIFFPFFPVIFCAFISAFLSQLIGDPVVSIPRPPSVWHNRQSPSSHHQS